MSFAGSFETMKRYYINNIGLKRFKYLTSLKIEEVRQIELTQSLINANKSVEETNKSIKHVNEVLMPANHTLQRKIGNRSLWLAGISTSFIILSTIFQMKDTSEKELEGLKKELQILNHTIDSFATIQAGNQQYLKNDSSRTLDTSHAPLPRHKLQGE